MNPELLAKLKPITEEERVLLNGPKNIQKNLYTEKEEFVIDSQKLLERGQLIEIRPHTRFCHFPKHRHNYVEMIYMCHGSTTHIINGKETITLSPGDLLFLNQYATQEILPAGEEDIAVNFIILPEFFDRSISMIERENVLWDFLISTLSQDTSLMSYLHFQAKDVLPVQNLIENMIWTLIEKKKTTNSINQVTMGLLFMNLSAFSIPVVQEQKNSYEKNLIFEILKYVESHYKSGTLSEISAIVNLPTYYVSRLLKKYTQSTFKELLQQRKLQQAVYFLTQTTLSVDAIIEAIGYNNSSFFYRTFREKYQCSPKEFRDGNSVLRNKD